MNICINEIKCNPVKFYCDEMIVPVTTIPGTTDILATVESKGMSMNIEVPVQPDQIVMNGHTPDYEETIRTVMKNITKELDT